MNLQFSTFIHSIAIFQLYFIALFLFSSKKGKPLSNRLLGTFFLLLALNLTDMLLSSLQAYSYYIRLSMLDDGIVLALGPLLYFYTQSMVYQDYTFGKSTYRHFLPFFVLTLFLVIIHNLNPIEVQKQLIEDKNNFELPVYINLFFLLLFLHPAIYVYKAKQALLSYRKRIKEKFSTVAEVNLGWLNFTLNSIIIFGIVGIIHALLPITIFKDYLYISGIFFIGFIFYFINAVLFKALNQDKIFSGIPQQSAKYQESLLDEDTLVDHKARLVHLLEKEKPYLKPELTIDILAAALDVHPKKLSQIINRAFGESFFSFINNYRIEEAKRLLIDPTDKKRTVLEILYQSGFNSKSSFNTIFKKKTGQTPSEFRRSHFQK